jgi:phosphoribosylamine--glycine ligase
VLEYNTRFGDPETQVVLPRLATDLLALLWAAARGELKTMKLKLRETRLRPLRGDRRPGLSRELREGRCDRHPRETARRRDFIIHAGTAKNAAGQIVTAGGRVLGVTALAPRCPMPPGAPMPPAPRSSVRANITAATSVLNRR